MAGGACAWTRRGTAHARSLRNLVRDTQRALDDAGDLLNIDPEIPCIVNEVSHLANRPTTLVLLGRTTEARVRLLHAILGRRLLPPKFQGGRWLKIRYGATTACHLTLGNSEFELVEELECNKQEWSILPLQDILRQDPMDLSTVLEVELSNQFLKDGLKIIMPPDFDMEYDSRADLHTLKEMFSEIYSKRDAILRNLSTVFLYAVDTIGKNIFKEDFCDNKMALSKSEEDFWSTHNLYTSRTEVDSCDMKCDIEEAEPEMRKSINRKVEENEPCVFDAMNCLDFHQMKEVNPNAQVFFVLLSDSTDLHRDTSSTATQESLEYSDATESTEDVKNEELPESDRNIIDYKRNNEDATSPVDSRRLYEEQCAFMNELLDQWELMSQPPQKYSVKSQWIILDDQTIMHAVDQKFNTTLVASMVKESQGKTSKRSDDDKSIKSRTMLLNKVVKFASDCNQTFILEFCTKLSEVHVKLLQQFILASFDLARELQVVPKKIQYVAVQEQQLYDNIHEKFSKGDKKKELLQLMQEVLQEMKTDITNMDWSVDDLPCHRDKKYPVSNSIFYQSRDPEPHVSIHAQEPNNGETCLTGTEPDVTGNESGSDVEEALSYDSYRIEDYEIVNNNEEINGGCDKYKQIDKLNLGDKLSPPQSPTNAGDVSTSPNQAVGQKCTYSTQISIKQASLDVQRTVLSKLSRKISLKLVRFVDCLKHSYYGTLERCLDSLEQCCRTELGGRPASEAMRSLVSVPRQVDLVPCAQPSLLAVLLHPILALVQRLRLSRGLGPHTCCPLAGSWRRAAAGHALASLSPHTLARLISQQILERLSVAHEKYQSALGTLEVALANRLHHTEDVKLAIRKRFAPGFARLCLESTSMCDLLMYGMPDLGREIGRGQYGVVYGGRGAWGGHNHVAIKSVLPADDRHYADLAMEFFYTRSMSGHPRIAPLYGSVVQTTGAGCCVLLVTARYTRDLHSAVKTGLAPLDTVNVALDIVDGIRYLHSLGLVHRDIKLKNVLLDNNRRAVLTDLGFCTTGALLSGSVVGTPVHMAPELLAGGYAQTVDVYAFGILLWYLCAGTVKLPANFEFFRDKEQLWSKVRRGFRPERLHYFSDSCWQLMTSCWRDEPHERALLGDIRSQLEDIKRETTEDLISGNCVTGLCARPPPDVSSNNA